MAQVLRRLAPPRHADLIVGTDTADDAAVWRRPDGRALVATADFFTPIVDDAWTWGRIAAANAASDVYAMGATPLFALNLVAWPRERLPLELLAEVLAGGGSMAEEGDWLIAGGHTVDGPEPMYGQAVVGEIDADEVLTNRGGRPADTIVLTKPIGTGIVATAVKRLEASETVGAGRLRRSYDAAVTEMTRLNAAAAAAARRVGAHAATDVTGFGLLGHLRQLAVASGVAAVVDRAAVPLLPDVHDLLADGFVPGGTLRNLDHVRRHVHGDVAEDQLTLLADAQTSGGLLIACDDPGAAEVVAELSGSGHTVAVIGHLTDGEPGRLTIL